MKPWHSLAMLVLFLAICLAAGAFGAIFTASSVRDWYTTLTKPFWTPPAWLFGPVWTTLYAMMAFAAWIVWQKRGLGNAKGALGLFVFQLALNAAWSPLFFGLRNPLAGLLCIIPLWAAILATIISFWRISAVAGALLSPYWLWVSFATALNVALWKMNR